MLLKLNRTKLIPKYKKKDESIDEHSYFLVDWSEATIVSSFLKKWWTKIINIWPWFSIWCVTNHALPLESINMKFRTRSEAAISLLYHSNGECNFGILPSTALTEENSCFFLPRQKLVWFPSHQSPNCVWATNGIWISNLTGYISNHKIKTWTALRWITLT